MANTNVNSINDSYMRDNSTKKMSSISSTISGIGNAINNNVNTSSTYAPSSGHGVAAVAALAGGGGGDVGVHDDDEASFPLGKKKKQLGNTAQMGAMLWTGEGEQAARGGGGGPLRGSDAVLRRSIGDGFRGGEAGAGGGVGVGMGNWLRGLSDLNALQQMYLSDSKDALAEGLHPGVSQSVSTLASLCFVLFASFFSLLAYTYTPARSLSPSLPFVARRYVSNFSELRKKKWVMGAD